jgi:hypothetical protein
MKSAVRENPNTLCHDAQRPNTWRDRSKQISLDQVGCEARKLPAVGDICFLTSPFIELLRTLAAKKRSDVISIAMSPVVYKGLEPRSQYLTFLPPGNKAAVQGPEAAFLDHP